MDSRYLLGRFHAKEYPAYDKDVFPLNMGYCQIGKLWDNLLQILLLTLAVLIPFICQSFHSG